MLLHRRDLQAVQNLWRQLSEFPASQPDAAMAWLLAGITRIIGGANITWIEAGRESAVPPRNESCGVILMSFR
jgi:hypothetical protein